MEEYEPGVTFYLSESLRVQFHQIGRTSAGERPAGTYARGILNRLLIDLSWASSRLEGNTYTRLDTQKLIEFGQAEEGKDIQETQMILNHKAAIEMLIEEAEQIGFNPFTFRNLHAILSENLLHDEDALWKFAPPSSRYFRVGIPPTGHAPCFGRLFPSTAAESFRHPRPVRTGVFRDGVVALSETL